MNPSERILNAVRAYLGFHSSSPHTSAGAAWQKSLLQPGDPESGASAGVLSERLLALTKQVNDLEEMLIKKEVPTSLIETPFKILRECFSPMGAATPWREVGKKFSSDLLTTLGWSSWVIGSIEEEISIEDIDNLLESLSSLSALIAEPGLPQPLRDLIEKNTQAIWDALELYPISGAAGLKTTISQILGEVMFRQDELRDAMSSSDKNTSEACKHFFTIIKETVEVFNSSVTAADNVIKIAAAVSLLKLTSN